MKLSFAGIVLLLQAFMFADARQDRGQNLRTLLLDALEQSHQHDGEWPEKIASGDLVYSRPEKFPDNLHFVHFPASTVVLRETFEKNPNGIWVGFGDGHLEFTPDAPTLAACETQRPLAEQAKAYQGEVAKTPTTKSTTSPSGKLKLKILDPDGKPVSGAAIGVFAGFGDVYPQSPHVRFAADEKLAPLFTDENGEAVVEASHAFAAKFYDQPTTPLWIFHEARDLVATQDVSQLEFESGATREIRLSPACHVKLDVESLGLEKLDRKIERSLCLANKPGRDRYYTLQGMFKGTSMDLPLPPGDWCLTVYATDTNQTFRYVHIAEGQREIKLHLDIPPQTAVENFGQIAPELVGIKGWKSGGPVTLEQLRGKVVILDFWGFWCNPCCESMPDLMKLHDEFHDKGLMIIGVHDDSVASIEEMDKKLVTIKKKQWDGRDLPFLIALDGGGKTRIKGTAAKADGATTAAYGITSFPTTLIIGKDGKLRGYFNEGSEESRAQLEKLLKE